MIEKTYEDGIRAGLEMAVIIANRTTRGKTAADAIMIEITTRQMYDDLAAKKAAFDEFWKSDKSAPEQPEFYRPWPNQAENRFYRTKGKSTLLERLKKALIFKC